MPSGAVHPNSIPGRWLLDRPVKPSDDSLVKCCTPATNPGMMHRQGSVVPSGMMVPR